MRPITIVGALVIGSVSLLSLSLHPILLGALEEAGRLSKAGIGQAAMLELYGLALGAAVGGYWMGRSAMRLKTALIAVGLAALNVATAYAESAAIVLAERAAAGILAGLLYGAANAIIVRSKNPDRLTGILVGSSVAPAIALAYVTPVILIPQFGPEAGFYLLGAIILLASVFAFGLVDQVSAQDRADRGRSRLSGLLLLFAGGVFLQGAGLGAAWVYSERLAHQHGFGPSVIGLAIAGGLSGQVVTAWLSAWVAPKTAKWAAILLLGIAQACFLALAIVTSSPVIFVLAVCIFASAAAATQAFQMAKVITLDPSRQTAVLLGPVTLLGNGIGPLVASFATVEDDVRGGFWTAVAMTAGAMLFYIVCAALAARREAASSRGAGSNTRQQETA